MTNNDQTIYNKKRWVARDLHETICENRNEYIHSSIKQNEYIQKYMRENKYLGGPGETITALADWDVEDEFLHLDFPHWVTQFPLRSLIFVFVPGKHKRHGNKTQKTELANTSKPTERRQRRRERETILSSWGELAVAEIERGRRPEMDARVLGQAIYLGLNGKNALVRIEVLWVLCVATTRGKK